MARSLPLQNAGETIDQSRSSSDLSEKLTGSVAVYDPAMCCSTGLCGPGVDPALLTIARDLRWLEKQGVSVVRFGLGQQPNAFVADTRVAGLMQAFGDDALPAVIVNGAVLCHGGYPSRDELVRALTKDVAPRQSGSSCCAPGSGCCS